MSDSVPGPDGFHGMGPFVALGRRLFFAANDGVHGSELWTTDGTAGGTRLVKDICPGPRESRPDHIVAVGHRLSFAAYDTGHGIELWTSDGTAAATRLVKDINPGRAWPHFSYPSPMAGIAGTLFFTARDRTHGYELWSSDGTASRHRPRQGHQAGTRLVAPFAWAAVDRTLFFNPSDGRHGRTLCRAAASPLPK